jgi:hypothetical protein
LLKREEVASSGLPPKKRMGTDPTRINSLTVLIIGKIKDFTEDKFVASVQRDYPDMTREEILKWLDDH